MKRVSADRPHWRRIRRKRFSQAQLEEPGFCGHVTLLQLDEVIEPLWVGLLGQQVCIVDAGFHWLQHFPAGARHTVTTMFDAGGHIVEWYIDICRRLGVDERGVPWYEDLYLDIVIEPAGGVELLDATELEAALGSGDITREEYDLAWREAHALLAQIERGAFHLPGLSQAHRQMLLRGAGSA